MYISPEQLFHTKVFCTAFMCLQFGFVIFGGKDLGVKAAHKMLVKLTPGIGKKQNIKHSSLLCRNENDVTKSFQSLGPQVVDRRDFLQVKHSQCMNQ